MDNLLHHLDRLASEDIEGLRQALIETPAIFGAPADIAELHDILWEDSPVDPSGRTYNAWYLAWERYGDLVQGDAIGSRSHIENYLKAVAVGATGAYAAATAAHDADARGESIGLGARYDLIAASIVSLSKDLPITVLSAFVREKIWEPHRAITYIREMSDEERQAAAASALIELVHRDEQACDQMIEVIRTFRDRKHKMSAITGVAAHLPWSCINRLLRLCDATTGDGFDRECRVDVLSTIAPLLPTSLHASAITIICALPIEEEPYRALIALVPEVAAEDLERIRGFLDRNALVQVVDLLDRHDKSLKIRQDLNAALAERYAQIGLLDRTFELIMTWPEELRTVELLRLWKKLPAPTQTALLGRIYYCQLWYQPEDPRNLTTKHAPTLIEALAYLPDEIMPATINIIIEQWDLSDGAWLFANLPVSLASEQRTALFRSALDALIARRTKTGRYDNLVWRTSAFNALIPLLPDELLGEAVSVAQRYLRERIERSGSIARSIPIDTDDQVWPGFNATSEDFIKGFSQSIDTSEETEGLVPLLRIAQRDPENLLAIVLRTLQWIKDPFVRLYGLAELAPHLSDAQNREALALAMRLLSADVPPNMHSRGDLIALALVKLARFAPVRLQDTLFIRARDMAMALERSTLLTVSSNITQHLPSLHLPALLSRALQASELIDDTQQQAGLIAALLPSLPFDAQCDVLDEAVDMVSLAYVWKPKESEANRWAQADREHVLGHITPVLARQQRFNEAYSIINERDPCQQIAPLLALMPHVDSLQQEEFFELSRSIAMRAGELERWVQVACVQARYLSEQQRIGLLTMSRDLVDHHLRAEAHLALFPWLPDTQRELVRGYLATYVATHNPVPLGTLAAIMPLLSAAGWRRQIAISLTADVLKWIDIFELNETRPPAPELKQASDIVAYFTRLVEERTSPDAEMCCYRVLDLSERVRALRTLEDLLECALVIPLLQTAQECSEPWRRVALFSATVPYVPEQHRMYIATQTFNAFLQQTEQFTTRGCFQVTLLLAPHLSDEDQARALSMLFRQIGELATECMTEPIALDALRQTLTALGAIPDKTLFSAWNQFLDAQAQTSRRSLLCALWATLPIAIHLGGSTAAAELFYAVRKVTKWWP